MAGLAIGFKYTAGLVLLPLLWRRRVWRDGGGDRSAIRDGLLAFGAAIARLLRHQPLRVRRPLERVYQLHGSRRSRPASRQARPGAARGGSGYYFQSLTWGLGWAPARGGARRPGGRGAPRRVSRRAADRLPGRAVHLPEPAGALLRPLAAAGLSVAGAARGRWRSPAVAGACRAGGWCRRPPSPWWASRLMALADRRRRAHRAVLGREDTRQMARDWLVGALPQRCGS